LLPFPCCTAISTPFLTSAAKPEPLPPGTVKGRGCSRS
jgi:hypothetical protein